MKVEELNMEPRELTLDELDDASACFGLLLVGLAGFAAGYEFGRWLRQRL